MKLKPIRLNARNIEHFWEILTEIVNSLAPKENRLTPKEKEIIVYILQRDPYKNQFRKLPRVQLKEFFNMRHQTIAMHKRSLEDKGWLDEGMLNTFVRSIHIAFTKEYFKYENALTTPGVDFEFKLRLHDGEKDKKEIKAGA